jgi:uncharacterized protein (TIGR03067 family)
MTHSGSSPIDGQWELVRAELNGEKAPDVLAHRTVLELAHGNYTVFFDGQAMDQGTYEIDESKVPKRIHLQGVEGLNAGRSIPSIYQHAGSLLRICYGLCGVMPKTFSSLSKDGNYQASYRAK